MPIDYGQGRLADAIRAAIAWPYGDAAEPAEFPSWDGASHRFRLHVHRDHDRSLRWVVEVSDDQGTDESRDRCRNLAAYCLSGLGAGSGIEDCGDTKFGWCWSRPLSPAEVLDVERAAGVERR